MLLKMIFEEMTNYVLSKKNQQKEKPARQKQK